MRRLAGVSFEAGRGDAADGLGVADGDAGALLGRRLQALDWSSAWLDGLVERGQSWQQALQSSAQAWFALLNQQAAQLRLQTEPQNPRDQRLPVRFVTQAELPAGQAHEAHIAATGQVPTRINLHDYFNAAMWFTYPRIKAALNACQAQQIALHGIQASRGGVRDALTLFDENAVLFACADPSLARTLREFDWHTLLVARRADWGRHGEVCVFGHALLEKLVAPYKAITAHVWIVEVPSAYFAWPRAQRRAHLDQMVAAQLAALRSPREFTPLPVLGIPGWWPANTSPTFYDDHQVFRPRRLGDPAARRVTLASQSGPGSRRLRKKGEESPDSNGQGDG